ncbi:FGGY-family carbohydrate kinase [Pelagibacterium luteolum]|uniref:FGGY-family pentulose kinase n=1 Tax=Pelagibacterium luteolum TaxID=440168 RepID=A0A1G7VIQ0_9HYPH|nr:FGGY-family carbohydrate kinase [Pelagibacterium luteolum]SDG59279.1 FGGY-family pentulose kinase [Pelagibacterium luteolum]
MTPLLVAVDVGTTSARAGVLTRDGAVLARAEAPIEIRREGAERAEHKSENIWASVCRAVAEAIAKAGADTETIVGIAFDATCSLVVRAKDGAPLAVGSDGDPDWDTIVWLDHRALAEAEEARATGHRVLDFAGGALSPEMEIPKLMWLKRNLPKTWQRAGYMFDLADFLSWKACGSLERSQSTLTSKWSFLAHEAEGWPADFLTAMGLEDLRERASLPRHASPIGHPLGTLTAKAARELGLPKTVIVGTGMVDAHAGALGVLGAFANQPETIDRHLGLIAGTSSAVTALATEPRPAPGVWGPYFGAVLPGIWLSEGGQSASGAALDHIIRVHSSGAAPTPLMHAEIINRITQLRSQCDDLAPRLHVLPDFHGNRSPFANPKALGVISGMSLDASFDGLCKLYWRGAVAIALGVRQILETLNARGYAIDTLHVTGGHTRNPLLMELYADATGCTVHELPDADAMLLGTAMAAATGAGLYPSLADAATAMRHASVTREPDRSRRALYDRDYAVFLKMHAHRAEIEAML